MPTIEPLDAVIKTRVPLKDKQALERIARERHLKMADILREATREKIASHPKRKAA